MERSTPSIAPETDRQLSLTVSLALRTGSGEDHPVRTVLELREGASRLSETVLYWDVVGGGGGA